MFYEEYVIEYLNDESYCNGKSTKKNYSNIKKSITKGKNSLIPCTSQNLNKKDHMECLRKTDYDNENSKKINDSDAIKSSTAKNVKKGRNSFFEEYVIEDLTDENCNDVNNIARSTSAEGNEVLFAITKDDKNEQNDIFENLVVIYNANELKEKPVRKEYMCEFCGNVLKSSSALNVHMNKHRNEKNVPCEICRKLFLTRSSMREHLLRHTGNRPYKCQRCSRKFYRISKCREHERTHNGIRSFECTCCKKSFMTNQNLKRHLLIHQSIMQYSCKICNKTFRLKHHLEIHLQTALHKERERDHVEIKFEN